MKWNEKVIVTSDDYKGESGRIEGYWASANVYIVNLDNGKQNIFKPCELKAVYETPEEILMNSVGKEIKSKRKLKNLTLMEAAQRMSLNGSQLCSYEKGKYIPSLGNLMKIAEGLDCELEIRFRPKRGYKAV